MYQCLAVEFFDKPGILKSLASFFIFGIDVIAKKKYESASMGNGESTSRRVSMQRGEEGNINVSALVLLHYVM